MLGLAAAAKFYPLFLAGPLLVLALRSGRWRAAGTTLAAGVMAWAVVNAPVFLFARHGWNQFWSLSRPGLIDWGTFWYIGVHTPTSPNPTGGLQPFLWLANHIPTLNVVTYGLFGLGCLGVLYLSLLAPRRPRLAQLCFLVVALFLLTSKVWSQQFVLWLIPLAVLARPRWGAFLAWQAAEIGYFLAFYAELLDADGQFTIPEGTFVLAAALRWVTRRGAGGVRGARHPAPGQRRGPPQLRRRSRRRRLRRCPRRRAGPDPRRRRPVAEPARRTVVRLTGRSCFVVRR